MTPPCCVDYRVSHRAKCITCKQDAQIMPGFGMCQTCVTGEASDPTEEWIIHSLDCKTVVKL